MRVFFLSDIHLPDGNGSAAQRFTRFLREVPSAGDCVILGGDIFDLFVGNKEVFRQKFAGPLDAVKELAAKGASVYYLEGNHDFHLGSVFGRSSGVQIMTDEFFLEAADRQIWVAHGDMIDPEDRGYRLLRAVTRHPVFRFLLKLLPGSWIDGIGRRSSHESRKYNNEARVDEPNKERLRQLYLGFAREKVREGIQHVLLGHSHLRDQVPIQEPGREGEYLNLGFTADSLAYAVLEAGQTRFALFHYP